MELIKKTILVHDGREISVLAPLAPNSNITSGHDHKGYIMIWGNGNEYQYMADCFSIASELGKDEMLYIPSKFKTGHEFLQTFNNCDYNLSIICTNIR